MSLDVRKGVRPTATSLMTYFPEMKMLAVTC